MSNVKVTFEFPNASAASAFLKQLDAPTDAPKEAPGKSADKPATKAKPAETPSSASPAPAASATPAPESKPADPKPVKYEDSGIGELIQTLVRKDRAATVALLNKFGAKKGTELLAQDYDKFKDEIGKLLEPAEESLS